MESWKVVTIAQAPRRARQEIITTSDHYRAEERANSSVYDAPPITRSVVKCGNQRISQICLGNRIKAILFNWRLTLITHEEPCRWVDVLGQMPDVAEIEQIPEECDVELGSPPPAAANYRWGN